MSKEFDAKRKELLEELNDILNNAEELFNEKSEAGAEELKKLKKNLSSQIKKINDSSNHDNQLFSSRNYRS